MKLLTWLVIISWIVYPILWIVGSEGTAALGLSQQVGLTTITDLVAKVRPSLYFYPLRGPLCVCVRARGACAACSSKEAAASGVRDVSVLRRLVLHAQVGVTRAVDA